MQCDFERIDAGSVQCRRCKRKLRTTYATVVAKCRETEPGEQPQVIPSSPCCGSPPPIIDRLASVAAAAARFVADGGRLAPPEVRETRHATCKACPKYDAAYDMCNVCGCVCAAKVFLPLEHCPLDPPKW